MAATRHAPAADERGGQDAYIGGVSDVDAGSPISESAMAQLRLSVAGSNAMRCGHKALDVELVIIARSLQRLNRHLKTDQVAMFELRVVQASVSRIAKVLRMLQVKAAESAGDDVFDASMKTPGGGDADDESEEDDDDGGDANAGAADADESRDAHNASSGASPGAGIASPALTNSAAGSPARMLLANYSPTRQQQQQQTREGSKRRGGSRGRAMSLSVNPELRGIRHRARNSIWPQILSVARHARGAYAFHLDPAEVTANSAALVRDAPAFGLGNIANRLVLMRSPQVRLVNFDRPRPGSVVPTSVTATSAADAVRTAFLSSAPNGAIDFMTGQRLPVRPSSSGAWGTHDVNSVLVKGAKPFMTTASDESQVSVDLVSALVMPTAYAFSSMHHIIPGCFPRTWRLLGSMDGIEWTTLRSHVEDESFNAGSQTVVFELETAATTTSSSTDGADSNDLQGVYRHLRLVNDGPNSSGTGEMQVHGFEVYGNLLFVQPDEKTSHGLKGPVSRGVPRGVQAVPQLDMGALLSTGKKKKKG